MSYKYGHGSEWLRQGAKSESWFLEEKEEKNLKNCVLGRSGTLSTLGCLGVNLKNGE